MDIVKTKNYDKFKLLNFNREVEQQRIGKIIQSINVNGFIVPILVSKDMYVIDGQHRLEAGKQLDIEVSYIVCDVETKQLPYVISSLNSSSKNWGTTDYLRMWANVGLDSYIYLKHYFDNSDVEFSTIFTATKTKNSRNSIYSFKNGEFTFTDESKAEFLEIMGFFNKIYDFVEPRIEIDKSKKALEKAIINIITNDNCDWNVLETKLEERNDKLYSATNYNEYLRMLSKIYNFKKSSKSIVNF